MSRRALFIITAIFVALVAVSPSMVLANGGPVTAEYGPGGVVLTPETTSVHVISEDLVFDFRHESGSFTLEPLVTAQYLLENQGDRDAFTTVAFFYVDVDPNLSYSRNVPSSFTIRWNDDVLEYSTESSGHWERVSGVEMHWLNPLTGKRYRTLSAPGWQVTSTLFQLTVPARSRGQLEVQYHQRESGLDVASRFSRPVWHYTYLLQPASTWASFENLNIEILFPPSLAVASEPRLAQVGSNQLELNFERLPEGNLHISVRETSLLDTWALPIFGLFFSAFLWVAGVQQLRSWERPTRPFSLLIVCVAIATWWLLRTTLWPWNVLLYTVSNWSCAIAFHRIGGTAGIHKSQ